MSNAAAAGTRKNLRAKTAVTTPVSLARMPASVRYECRASGSGQVDEALEQSTQMGMAVDDVLLDLDAARLVGDCKHAHAIRPARKELLEIRTACQGSGQVVGLADSE